ncbi:PTS system transporter subunit IIA [Streptococcus pneumoniae]|nr:PTS system transporter subunit IIA [Streptococcus pneumoniae]
MTEEMEYICFQLIANSGAAKSSFIPNYSPQI